MPFIELRSVGEGTDYFNHFELEFSEYPCRYEPQQLETDGLYHISSHLIDTEDA